MKILFTLVPTKLISSVSLRNNKSDGSLYKLHQISSFLFLLTRICKNTNDRIKSSHSVLYQKKGQDTGCNPKHDFKFLFSDIEIWH